MTAGRQSKVVLVYDERPLEIPSWLPPDFGLEYEDARTVEALLGSIRACGYAASGLALSADFPESISRLGPDLVFNISEGVRGPGRESLVPSWCEHFGITYTGSDALTLAVSLDKALTKTLVSAHGVPTPAFRLVDSVAGVGDAGLRFPVFVKPNAEGSSMGISRESLVHNAEDLTARVAWITGTYGQGCLVEEYLPGREYCVGLLGNGELRALPVVEIRTASGLYGSDEKRVHSKELICPADLQSDLADRLREQAETSYRALRCRDFARVDFRLDAAGEPGFLEINPLPGLSPFYSVFTRQAEAAGLSHADLIGRIIELAFRRAAKRSERGEERKHGRAG